MKINWDIVKPLAVAFGILIIVAFSMSLVYNYASADTNLDVQEDGLISCSWASNSWNANRTMSCDNYDASNNTNTPIAIGNTVWDTRRPEFIFDTSVLDATAIATATIDFTFNYWQSGTLTQTFYVIAGDPMPAWDYTDMANPDFTSFGTCDFDDPADNEKIVCNLNAAGIAHIDPDGDTVFALIQDMDYDNTTGDDYIGWIYSQEFSTSRGAHLNIGYADAGSEPEPGPEPEPVETCGTSTLADITSLPYTALGWDGAEGGSPSWQTFTASSTYTLNDITFTHKNLDAAANQIVRVRLFKGGIQTSGCATGSYGLFHGDCYLELLADMFFDAGAVGSVGTTTITFSEPIVLVPDTKYTIGFGEDSNDTNRTVQIRYHQKAGSPYNGGHEWLQGSYPAMSAQTDRDLAITLNSKDCALDTDTLTEDWLETWTPTVIVPEKATCYMDDPECAFSAWYNRNADNFALAFGWCTETASSTVCIRRSELAIATATTAWTGELDDGSAQLDDVVIEFQNQVAGTKRTMWGIAYNILPVTVIGVTYAPGEYLIQLANVPVYFLAFSIDTALCDGLGGTFCSPIASTCDDMVEPATTTNDFGFPTFDAIMYSLECSGRKIGAWFIKPDMDMFKAFNDEVIRTQMGFPWSTIIQFSSIIKMASNAWLNSRPELASIPLLMPDGTTEYLITPGRWDAFAAANPRVIYWHFKVQRTILYGLLLYWLFKRIAALLKVPENAGNIFLNRLPVERRKVDKGGKRRASDAIKLDSNN